MTNNAAPRRVESPEAIAKRVRRVVLRMVHETGSPHIGSAFSCVEALVALFDRAMNVSPDATDDPGRDRFIMSKGHACAALYAVLAEFGFCTDDDVCGFAADDGVFEEHPSMDTARGIEVTTGSLGHGLSIGAGMALAGAIDGAPYRVFVLMSDGELNEGSVWEAVMFAAQHRLANLVALVDANGMQALGHTRDIIDLEPIAEKWRAFGWHVIESDGHDFDSIGGALSSLSPDRPNVIVLKTVKGKGVSFMEDDILWHYRAPDEREYELALEELAE